MAFRLYDHRCKDCSVSVEHLIDVPHGEKAPLESWLDCTMCGTTTLHARELSKPAAYMGEKAENPVMRGGSYDTAGFRQLPPLPDLPGEAERASAYAKAIESNPGVPEHEVLRKVDAPSASDYKGLFQSKAWKQAKHDRELVTRENAAKRKRLRALQRGEVVNMKRDRCKGDPKFT